MTGLARLGAVFEDAARTATDLWLRRLMTERGMAEALAEPEWPSLVTAVRHAALAGHDPERLIDDAIRMRPVHDANSTTAVLHWRLSILTDTAVPARSRGPLASLPPTDGPAIEVARQAGELMRQRWHELRTMLAATVEPLPWAQDLGARPADAADQAVWLTAATAVGAYRERYEVPDHTPMLGPRPAAARPDARAAWNHARLQADRYLARRLRHLDDQQLVDLDARQQTIITSPPRFDPAQLERARRTLDDLTHGGYTTLAPGATATATLDRARRAVERLEAAAHANNEWRRTAAQAAAMRRQIALELQRRTDRHNRSRTATGRGAR